MTVFRSLPETPSSLNTLARPAPKSQRVPISERPRLDHQPALDGIRALAVSAVLVFHEHLPWGTGGFLGVEAFFVLSGYLITSLLLGEWRATGRLDVFAFWARRARRLLPALFFLMLGIAAYALVFAEPQELDNLRGDAVATLLAASNWRMVGIGHLYYTPLGHAWSLGVEQQWYLVWPFIVFGLLRVSGGPQLSGRSVRLLFCMAVALAAASAILMARLYEPGAVQIRAAYGTDTRAQSLLVGSALAVVLDSIGPVRNIAAAIALEVIGVAAAMVVAWAWLTMSPDDAFLFRGGFLLLALAVALVIAAAVQPGIAPLGRLLSLAPLRALGLISYGVYLWHVPVYWVLTPARTGLDGYGLFLARALLTLIIAVISYNLIETPFRRGVLRQWRASWTLAPAGAMSLAVIVFLFTRGGV